MRMIFSLPSTIMCGETMKFLIVLFNKKGIDDTSSRIYTQYMSFAHTAIRPCYQVGSRSRCSALMREIGYRFLADWELIYSYERDNEYYEIYTERLKSNLKNNYDYRVYF